MSDKSSLTPIPFNFYSLTFTPYKEHTSSHSSNDILRKVITYISQQKQEGKGHLIDRHEGRKNDESREIFMNSAVFMFKEKRIRCSMALLRSGRKPMLKPKDKFQLISLDESHGSIAEQTHFFIDYSRSYAVLCVEYNHYGPRISDIEYYLRNVSRDTLKLSKVTETTVYMDRSIDVALQNMKNVLNMDIKIQPKNFTKMDNDIVGEYFTGMNNLGHKIKPKFIKLEALFQTPGKGIESRELNPHANKMFQYLLKKFKARPFNIDCFDSFVVKYEDKDGQEEVFNLLKGKKEVVKDVDLASLIKQRDWYALIEEDFNEFMNYPK